MSTRLTVKRGFDAVAMTVMRYRCSAGDTSRYVFCQGWPVGTKTTSSRPNTLATSLAATRCPWWTGSNVPPMTPRRERADRTAGRCGSVPVRDAAEREGHEQQDGEERDRQQGEPDRGNGQGRGLLGALGNERCDHAYDSPR